MKSIEDVKQSINIAIGTMYQSIAEYVREHNGSIKLDDTNEYTRYGATGKEKFMLSEVFIDFLYDSLYLKYEKYSDADGKWHELIFDIGLATADELIAIIQRIKS